jgi:excisionase family DNA binding protein
MADGHRKPWLTVKEFADLANYHQDTVYKKIARGEIDGVVHHGRDIRINRVLALSVRRTRDDDESKT